VRFLLLLLVWIFFVLLTPLRVQQFFSFEIKYSFQVMALVGTVFVLFRNATRPTIVAPPPVLHSSSSSGSYVPILTVGPRLSFDMPDLPELNSLTQSSSLRSGRSGEEDESLTSTQCKKCRKAVTRGTRHICGSCHYAFCMACTVYHPHMDVHTPLGKYVASACGIESRCRCAECYDGPPIPSPSQIVKKKNKSKAI